MDRAIKGRLSFGSLLSFNNKFLAILKYIALMLVDAFGLIIFYAFLRSDSVGLALVFLVVTIGANIIIFVPGLYPLRWMNPGLILITLLVVYPVILTAQTAFTNLSDGHRFTKRQSLDLIEDRGYVPEDAIKYNWIPFRRDTDEFALWLVGLDGQAAFALPGQPIQDIEADQFGLRFSEAGDVPQVAGYQAATDLSVLANRSMLEYEEPIGAIQLDAIDMSSQYVYDPDRNIVFDQTRGTIYTATVFSRDDRYLLWLTNPSSSGRALLAMPGASIVNIDLNKREELRENEIRNLDANQIPQQIGDYSRFDATITPDIASQLAEIEGGLRVEPLDFSDRYVFDREQGITLDLQSGVVYETVALISDDSERIALWLDGGRRGTFLIRPDGPILFNGIPLEFAGYRQIVNNLERTAALRFLQEIEVDYFGVDGDTVGVINTREAGRPYAQRYVYDEAGDFVQDTQTGVKYFADNETGTWVPDDRTAEPLNPGFQVFIGFENFSRMISDPAFSGPLGLIFVWTCIFALLSVVTTFIVGLAMAIIIDPAKVGGAKIIRSLLIIPYAIPGVISILVWRGLMNENIGLLTTTISQWFGFTLPWFSDPFWAKAGLILVNLWLGYPYMMLICAGALQAIPSDIYEAAAVDGAKPFQRFWNITLPLLLITVGPLLIASFTFNFNNYLIIEALTAGNPPIPGTPTPAGHTDLLINYTYNVAFSSGGGADFGYASALTLVIFAIVATITLFNFRLTKSWEETGENV